MKNKVKKNETCERGAVGGVCMGQGDSKGRKEDAGTEGFTEDDDWRVRRAKAVSFVLYLTLAVLAGGCSPYPGTATGQHERGV